MKTDFTALVLLAAAAAGFSIGAVAADEACPPTEVTKFIGLVSNPHLGPCQKVSAGFSMVPPTGYPTPAQVKSMCASDACHALIKDVLGLKPTDCELTFSGTKLNAYKLASSFDGACKTDAPKSEKTPEQPPKDGGKHDDGKHDDGKHDDGKDGGGSKEDKDGKDGKHTPTLTPTYYPTPKPTKDDKYYPTPKPTNDKDHSKPEKTKAPKDDKDHPAPTAVIGKGNKYYPMPNTTYKAEEQKPHTL
ncbi:hypothetical protein BBJ28_00024460 [Nothophytophthora sp. Chile5]|nr:hypothetical protein BBJ28_00024460 [Nothophytophthora sp. Chile5]